MEVVMNCMHRGSMFNLCVLLVTSFLIIACQKETSNPVGSNTPGTLTGGMGTASTQSTANLKGSGGDMPAYYDGKLFTINFARLPAGGEQANLKKNSSINITYMS